MKTLLSLLLFVTTTLHAGEVGSPEWIARNFFEEDSFPNTEKYYIGEMSNYLNEANMGSRIPEEVVTAYRILQESPDRIVYGVTYSHEDREQNWYCFLKKEEDIWKLQAVRTLALPGFFYSLLQQLHEKDPRAEEEEWEYKNMLLQTTSDSKLKEYFIEHMTQFEVIVALITDPSPEQAEGTEEQSRGLHLSGVNRLRSDPRCIDFLIGGIMDNSVGYLYVPPGSIPPILSAEHYIYLEKISPNWYAYKTT